MLYNDGMVFSDKEHVIIALCIFLFVMNFIDILVKVGLDLLMFDFNDYVFMRSIN